MAKPMKKADVLKCPIHEKIMEQCKKELKEFKYFNKKEVLRETRSWGVESAIRWDWIREFLSGDEFGVGMELIPVAQKFFKTPKEVREREGFNIGTCLAGGTGKKTAGFALITIEGGRLALAHVRWSEKVEKGTHKAAERRKTSMRRHEDQLHPHVVSQLEDARQSKEIAGG